MKLCPYCAEEVQDAAIVCKHCGRDLVPPVPQLPLPKASKVKVESKQTAAARVVGGIMSVVGVLGCSLAILVTLEIAISSGGFSIGAAGIACVLAVLLYHCIAAVLRVANSEPKRRQNVAIVITCCIVATVTIGAGLESALSTDTKSAASHRPESGLTITNYLRLQEGMSYAEVVAILGEPGEELSRTNVAGFSTVMYSWKRWTGANMNAMFQNDRLVTKAQFGLD